MEKIKQKVEHVLGKDHDTTTTSGTGTHGTTSYGTTTGHTTQTTGTGLGGTHGSDPTGPHDSRLANKADPRVDSDRVGGHGNTTSTGGGYGQHSGVTGYTTQTTGTGLGGTYGSDPTGPHDSRLANKADPRIDSDRVGGHGNTTSTGGGYGQHSGVTGPHHSDPTGPHDTRMANKLDPRVSDSDRIGGHSTTGARYGTGHGSHTGAGLTGGNYRSDPTGPHDSRMGNKLDPTVDSDRIGTSGNYGTTHNTGLIGNTHGTHATGGGLTGNTHGTHTTGGGLTGNTHGTHTTGGGLTGDTYGTHHSNQLPGPADKTAGPHTSNLANRADPRVDSDLDGSKKVGGDRTFG